MKKFTLLPAFFAMLLFAVQAPSEAAKYKGRISLSYYNYNDETGEYDFNISRTYLKFVAKEFMSENTTLNYKSSTRSKGNKDYNSEIPDFRLYYANVEMKHAIGNSDIIVGRHYIDEISGAGVDGAQLKYWLGDDSGFGGFAGMKPNPYDDKFSSDYTSTGAYGFLKKKKYGINGGISYSTYKGKEDSTYGYGYAYYFPSNVLRVFSNIRADHNVKKGGFDLTNMMANFSYKPTRKSRIGASYTLYRAIKYYESMDYDLNHELQKVLRLYGNYRPWKKLKIYGTIYHRTRGSDNKSAFLVKLGAKKSDIMKWLYVNGSVKQVHYFTSDSTWFYGSVGAEPTYNLRVELNATMMTQTQDDSYNTLRQWIYGAEFDWLATRKIYIIGTVEVSNEKYLAEDSVYTAKASDEYKSTSFYFQAGYRF